MCIRDRILPIASAKLDIIHGCAMVPSLTPMVLLVVGSTLVCVHPHTPIGLGMWVCHTIPLCSPHALTGFVGHSQGPAAGSQARRVQTEKRREDRDISPSPGRGELDPEDVCPVRVRSMWSKVVLVDKVAAAKLPLYFMFNFALAFDSRRVRSVDVVLNRP